MSEKNINFLLEEFKDDDSYLHGIILKLKKYENWYFKKEVGYSLIWIIILIVFVLLVNYTGFFFNKLKLLLQPQSINTFKDLVSIIFFNDIIIVILLASLYFAFFDAVFNASKELLNFRLRVEFVSISRIEIEYLNDFLYEKRKLNKYNIVKYMSDNVYYLKEGEMKLLNKNNPAVMLDEGCVVYETYYEYHIARDWLVAKTNLYGDRKKDY